MMILLRRNLLLIIFISGLSISLFSCSSSRNLQYFRDIPDSGKRQHIATALFTPPVIQPDDILNINVLTTDLTATQSINAGNQPIQITGAAIQPGSYDQITTGYLVDKDGNVQMPVIGQVKLAGLTTVEARELLTRKATVFFKDPTVIVRNKNFKITVLGEVNKPATYIIPNEQVTILDALALAGDLTVYGKRENVLLLRKQDNGESTSVRINLNQSSLLKSPYFYLRQNDVLYVEPSRQKVAAANVTSTRNFTIITSLLTLVIVLIQVFKH